VRVENPRILAVHNFPERKVVEIHDTEAGIAYTITRLKSLGQVCYRAPRGTDRGNVVWMTIVHYEAMDRLPAVREFVEMLSVWARRWGQ